MTAKLVITEVRKRLLDCGFELLDNAYLNSHKPLTCRNSEGYIIRGRLRNIENGANPNPFDKSNPHTINNIKLWLKKTNSDYKLKDGQIYNGSDKKLIFICPICGDFKIRWDSLKSGCGCGVCVGKQVNIGINDLATVRPDLIKYFKNKEDTYKYTEQSGQIIDAICSNCGFEKKISIHKLNREGLSCNQCSDGISTPNKFLVGVFNQLNVDFKTEKSFEECNYRYDLYVEYDNNKKYTIEAHGAQHYRDVGGNRRLLQEEQENDRLKREFSESLGNIHIEIDCRYSDFRYLKNQFIKSLSPYFQLLNIKWNKVYEYCMNNLMFEICKIRKESNNIKSSIDIENETELSRTTIINYLKRGNELGLCVYNAKDEIKNRIRKNSKPVRQFTKNYEFIREFVSIREASRITNVDHANIARCCTREYYTAGGYIWKYKI